MIVSGWHAWVKQPKKDKAWHESDVADEFLEYQEAPNLIYKWSELSDVVYTVTRARWSGHKLPYPISWRGQFMGYIYMFPKYSLRVLFFRRAGRKSGAKARLESVRNPKKEHKLRQIAEQNNIDPDLFVEICKQQLKHWPLLP
ncbi:MAG: hypothetical protein ABI354_00440 [Candidatus Saccharimonadales bacterium]